MKHDLLFFSLPKIESLGGITGYKSEFIPLLYISNPIRCFMKINIFFFFFLVFVTIPGLVINKNNQIVKREEIGVESQSSKSVSAEETASSTK